MIKRIARPPRVVAKSMKPSSADRTCAKAEAEGYAAAKSGRGPAPVSPRAQKHKDAFVKGYVTAEAEVLRSTLESTPTAPSRRRGTL
jgi:hypothetical protein